MEDKGSWVIVITDTKGAVGHLIGSFKTQVKAMAYIENHDNRFTDLEVDLVKKGTDGTKNETVETMVMFMNERLPNA
jgi:hypothetical protein